MITAQLPPVTPQETKVCIKCGAEKKLSEFFANREWKEQSGKDAWCKDCVSKLATKEEIKEYLWENNKEFTGKLWDDAMKKAIALAEENATFRKSSEERKARMLERLAAQQISSVIQTGGNYRFVDNKKRSGGKTYAEAKEAGEIVEEEDPSKKKWSDEWCGNFTDREIRWLDAYYRKLSQDGKLEFDATQDDYAHKIAHQSLLYNKAISDYAAGRCDYSVVKDAATVFDNMNKSANFAACRKKSDDDNNKLAVAEIAQYLESHGHPCTRKVEWPKDDVDMCIAELHHIIRAVGLDD